MFENTKKFCDSFLDLGLPGFDLAVYKDGECILRHIGGYSDLENKIPMNGKERYNIYSCSKVITCVAAMQLWEKGLFSLDDKLSDYMPEFAEMTVKTEDGGVKKAENPIYIKNLFEMTAGFSYNGLSENMMRARSETDGRCPTRETMKYLAKDPLLFEPGARWEYSLAHDVIAALVEVVSGEKFEDYVKKNIFDPLGMKDSSFMIPDEELDTVCQQYRFEDGVAKNIGKRISYKYGTEYASGGAGCISTVDDYMKFLEALRVGDVILKKETIDLMTTDRLNEQQKKTFWNASTHGYGLGIRCPNGNEKRPDFGWGGAASAWLAVDRVNNISLYFGTHMLSSPIAGLRSSLYSFIHAEMFDISELDAISEDLKKLHNYNLTY